MSSDLDRRTFLRKSSVAVAGLPLLRLLEEPAEAQEPTPEQVLAMAPANLSWRTVITSPEEPGEPLVVSGTIYAPDRRTPVAGAILTVYHTDARGYYARPRPNDDPHHPRLRGWMKTGPDGRYEFRTIKPAPYPGRRIPAHIHGTMGGPRFRAQWVAEYWFEGDPFLTPSEIAENAGKGSFSAILALRRDASGVLRGVRDLQLS